MKLPIVSPVYRTELVLEELVERISKSIPSNFISHEIILVDDYSLVDSWSKTVTVSSFKFLNGCKLTILGIFGLYIGKTFEGIKNNPSYIIEKTTDE